MAKGKREKAKPPKIRWGLHSKTWRDREYAKLRKQYPGITRKSAAAMYNRGTWNPSSRDPVKRTPLTVRRHPAKYVQPAANKPVTYGPRINVANLKRTGRGGLEDRAYDIMRDYEGWLNQHGYTDAKERFVVESIQERIFTKTNYNARHSLKGWETISSQDLATDSELREFIEYVEQNGPDNVFPQFQNLARVTPPSGHVNMFWYH